jgi:subtilase family serine protease
LIPFSIARRNVRGDVLSAVYEFATDDGKSIFGARSISKQGFRGNPRAWTTKNDLVKYTFETNEIVESGVELGTQDNLGSHSLSHGIGPQGHLAISYSNWLMIIDTLNGTVLAKGEGMEHANVSSDMNQIRFALLDKGFTNCLIVWEADTDPERVNCIIKEDTVSQWNLSEGSSEMNLSNSISVAGDRTGIILYKLVSGNPLKYDDTWEFKHTVVILNTPARKSREQNQKKVNEQ